LGIGREEWKGREGEDREGREGVGWDGELKEEMGRG